jgi:phospholipid/cholesterol/gamma-HCH transport system substrate-binding protein
MTSAIQKHLRDFVAIIVLIVLALGVGSYILSNQRFYLPGWVPVIGTDFFELKGEFETAQSVMPGQGQTVDIAGVPIGDVKKVELKEGRAIITTVVREKYAPLIKKDAFMMLRPKTGLNDMIIQLTPGSAGAEKVPDGFTVPIRNTLPNIGLDAFIGIFDRDTRDYLNLLLQGGGSGLKGKGRGLSAVLRRFEPTNRDILAATKEVAKRRKSLARLIHSFQLLATELGRHDRELARWVNSSSAVFQSFANQDRNLQETVRLLPDALDSTNRAVTTANRVARDLGPAARAILPGARAFAGSQRQSRPFFRETLRPIRDQIRPFARDVRPTVRTLRPANRDLAALTPNLRRSFSVLNKFLNGLAYNPPGAAEGFLFYTIWGAHIGASVFSTQDAHGPIRRGLIMTTCRSLGVLESVRATDRQLSTIIELLNPPTQALACPGGATPAPAAPGR